MLLSGSASPARARALALVTLVLLAGAPAAAEPDDDTVPSYACVPVRPAATVTAAFGPDVSIAELATWVAGVTCESVVIAPGVAKHATKLQVIAPRPLTPREAVKLFVTSLEAAGLKVKRKDRTFTVTPGPGMPRTCPDVAVTTGADGAPVTVAAPPSLDAERLGDKLARSVRRKDATHAEVPRAVVDQLMANPEALGRSARVLPAVVNGAVVGFKLYAVRPGSVLARLGIVNGDVVTAVGGQPLDSLDHALDAYGALRGASQVDIAIVRRGRPLTLTLAIVP